MSSRKIIFISFGSDGSTINLGSISVGIPTIALTNLFYTLIFSLILTLTIN
ncbi:MAG: hypothetical protein IPM96_03080 [Ignavibacteria bacterium]|nr:hypothetical protein [Ignavibacteria bacterium]